MTKAVPAGEAARAGDPNVLISLVASAATACLVVAADEVWRIASAELVTLVAFVALTAALQLVSVEVYGRGSISFAGTGLLALGFVHGAEAAVAAAALMGAVNLAWRRGRLNRGVFDAAQFALAIGAGAGLYHLLVEPTSPLVARSGAAVCAAVLYMLVNLGLLCLAMSLAEGAPPLAIWRERFRWFTPYYLASGPLALALVIAYERTGLVGLAAFALPPAFMMLSVRQYIARTRTAVEEIRAANAELATRNEDLHSLFELTGGLAATTHDRVALEAYVEQSLRRLFRADVRLSSEPDGGTHLVAGARVVGSIRIHELPDFDEARWARLRDAILPQIATAMESVGHVEEVRRQHLATIAALSRSMEAKDDYTGGHTERVSSLAVALAKRLDYHGSDLDAIEIGALLHDIGKIGVPERILHKAGPLNEEEWAIMKEHPLISEYILSGIGLSPIVLQIARSSHERIDGRGYPDGKAGEEIPLPARIVLVADAVDALTSDRPYRPGRDIHATLREVRANAGSQFCPAVVAALESVYRDEPDLLTTPIDRAGADVIPLPRAIAS